jgi:hypothetical protein
VEVEAFSLSSGLSYPVGVAATREQLTMNHLNVVQQTLVEKRMLTCLIDGLKDTMAWKIAGDDLSRKLSTLKFIFRSFQSHMERLMGIEERDGYMDEVLEKQPQLSKTVEELRRQHDEFRAAMVDVASDLNHVTPAVGAGLNGVVKPLTGLLAAVDAHNQKEADLLQEAMEREEGGEG